MPRPAPLFANDRNSAALLDMKPAEFRNLVEGGALPKPIKIGDFERWDVEQLRFIASGGAAEGGPIEW